MLKRIPKSDISIRPFKAYKEWSFQSGYAENALSSSFEFNERVSIYNANIDFGIDEYLEIPYTSSNYPNGNVYKYYPKSIYGQLRAQFYNGNEDNPFTRTGNKSNVYNIDVNSKERYLSDSAKVLSIPQIYVGEGIKKGSVYLLDSTGPYIDDNNGNIISQTGLSEIDFNYLDLSGSAVNPAMFYFTAAGKSFTAAIDSASVPPDPYFVDIQSGQIEMEIDGLMKYANITSIDIQTGKIYVNGSDFLPSLSLGNVFYNQGLLVFTRNLDLILQSNWSLSYKSTKTIYENEYLLIVNQDEFNVSTNPSAVVNVGRTTETHIDSNNKTSTIVTNPGVNYIRQYIELPNGTPLDYRYHTSHSFEYDTIYGHGTPSSPLFVERKGGFEQTYVSSSIDTTGSFLTPMITTIGLYDDDCQLVAVAKLPQPIKSEHDIPVNFIVRFDT